MLASSMLAFSAPPQHPPPRFHPPTLRPQVRDDKGWQDATSLDELKALVKASKSSEATGEMDPEEDGGDGEGALAAATRKLSDRRVGGSTSHLSGGSGGAVHVDGDAAAAEKAKPKAVPKRMRPVYDAEDDDDEEEEEEMDDDDDDEGSSGSEAGPGRGRGRDMCRYVSFQQRVACAGVAGRAAPKKQDAAQLHATVNPPPSTSYGAKCYQKNADHRRRFAHPGDDDYIEGGPSAAAGKRRRKPVSYADAADAGEDDEEDEDEDMSSDAGSEAYSGGSHERDADAADGAADASGDGEPPAKRAATAEAKAAEEKTSAPATDAAALGLADLFTDMTFYVSKTAEDAHQLTRLAVAFDGEITHVDAGTAITCILVDSLDPKSWPEDIKAVVAKHPGGWDCAGTNGGWTEQGGGLMHPTLLRAHLSCCTHARLPLQRNQLCRRRGSRHARRRRRGSTWTTTRCSPPNG